MISLACAILSCSVLYTTALCPRLYHRSEWGGRTARQIEYSIFPNEYVIVHHTETSTCHTISACSKILTDIQEFHMDRLEFHDIGYNFLIDGQGNVYEGVNWHKCGAHTRGFNNISMGIAFIGDFSDTQPTKASIRAAKQLLSCGVESEELYTDYKILPARQFTMPSRPGNGKMLYSEIRKWPQFTNKPFDNSA